MGLIPKISSGNITKTLMSESVLAVGSALIFGTLASNKLTEFIGKVPFLSEHITFGLIGISIVILIISAKMKSGVLKAIVIGLAGGSFFIAILQVDIVRENLANILG